MAARRTLPEGREFDVFRGFQTQRQTQRQPLVWTLPMSLRLQRLLLLRLLQRLQGRTLSVAYVNLQTLPLAWWLPMTLRLQCLLLLQLLQLLQNPQTQPLVWRLRLHMTHRLQRLQPLMLSARVTLVPLPPLLLRGISFA